MSRSGTAVERWTRQLSERVGLDDVEAKGMLETLLAFCEGHGTDPDSLLAEWESYPQLTVRRRAPAAEAPDLAVESFLIHNGINVFGDIVCVAGRPEDLAAQGPQFGPRTD